MHSKTGIKMLKQSPPCKRKVLEVVGEGTVKVQDCIATPVRRILKESCGTADSSFSKEFVKREGFK
jgi:hypothetical protein